MYPPIPPDPVEIFDLPPAHELWRQVAGDVTAFRAKFFDASSAITDIPGEFMIDLDSSIEFNINPAMESLSTDYHPPSYVGGGGVSFTEESIKQSQRGKNVTKYMLETLTDISKLSLLKAVSRNISSTSLLSNLHFTGSSFTLSTPKLSAAPFSAPKINTLEIFGHFDTLIGLLYLMDSVYRLWLSLRVVRRHWNKGLVDLPPCDLRGCKLESVNHNTAIAGQSAPVVACDEDVEVGNATKEIRDTYKLHRLCNFFPSCRTRKTLNGPTTLTQSVIVLATSFPVQICLLGLFIMVVCYSLIALYVPWYNSYLANCIDYSDDRGTLIGRNIRAIGLNYASSAGNERLLSKFSKYNDEMSNICSQELTRTKAALVNQTDFYNSLGQKSSITLSHHNSIVECIDIQLMDNFLSAACCLHSRDRVNQKCLETTDVCPMDQFSNWPVRAYLPSTSCLAPDLQIDNKALYNCRFYHANFFYTFF